ncbi:MAG: hypothetical protein KJ579_06430 [Verrucomicrobia bacterium]|nr:hypothetical protein [Verrucomicrobiota bacterium]
MNVRIRWKSIPPSLRIAAGGALIVLGIVGLFLPVLQGLLFITLGLTLLARDVPWARRLIGRIRSSRLVQDIRRRIAGWRRRTGAGPGGPGR